MRWAELPINIFNFRYFVRILFKNTIAIFTFVSFYILYVTQILWHLEYLGGLDLNGVHDIIHSINLPGQLDAG